MKVDAITCCTGKVYAKLLAKSLLIWLDTLDSLTIVCKPEDTEVRSFKGSNLRIITTDVFTAHGAHLNKGAALNYAYAAAAPEDWVLHFDSDIIPPRNWRKIAESYTYPGWIHGAPRRLEDGNLGDTEKLFWPFGYFQLWHSQDPMTWRWPMFDPWHPHCGSYDADFAELWGKTVWKKLPFVVEHQGVPRTNWFGTEKTHLMKPLLKVGLFKYRIMSKGGVGRLKIPNPELKLFLDSGNKIWVQTILKACQQAGPFLVFAKTNPQDRPGGKWERVNDSTDAESICNIIRQVIKEHSHV